jgi:hypothetical protein
VAAIRSTRRQETIPRYYESYQDLLIASRILLGDLIAIGGEKIAVAH